MTACLLTCKEVAEILQISPAKSYTMTKTGEIPSVRFGKLVRVRPEDLESFISANRVGQDLNYIGIGRIDRPISGGELAMTNYPSPLIDRGIYPNNPFSPQFTPQGVWTGLCDLHTARDALEPLPPEEWVVEQIIKPGSISIFFGDPGCKKTFSLLDLGTHVASGEEWLGRKVRQGKVLYLDEDMGKNELHARIGNNLRANDCDGETPIHWKSMGG